MKMECDLASESLWSAYVNLGEGEGICPMESFLEGYQQEFVNMYTLRSHLVLNRLLKHVNPKRSLTALPWVWLSAVIKVYLNLSHAVTPSIQIVDSIYRC
jgi:hypothetical protein